MANKGNAQLLVTFVAKPEQVDEVDRLIASHAEWMEKTHYREGNNALLSYNFSKGDELTNALDPSSPPSGNTRYVLNEIYESPEGISDHWQQAQASWSDFGVMLNLIASCGPQTLHAGQIAASLW
jgi:hypothetical protein